MREIKIEEASEASSIFTRLTGIAPPAPDN